MYKHNIPVNTVFGEWTVVSEPFMNNTNRAVLARCSCGSLRPVSIINLVKGVSKRCTACASRRRIEWREENPVQRLFQHIIPDPRLRARWLGIHQGMLRRCYDQNAKSYASYGGRGIVVCAAWHDRETFLLWVSQQPRMAEPRISINRINVHGEYSPDNCNLADAMEQGADRCNSVLVCYGDDSLHAAAFVRKYLPGWTLSRFLKNLKRLPVEEIVSRYRAGRKAPAPKDFLSTARSEILPGTEVNGYRVLNGQASHPKWGVKIEVSCCTCQTIQWKIRSKLLKNQQTNCLTCYNAWQRRKAAGDSAAFPPSQPDKAPVPSVMKQT